MQCIPNQCCSSVHVSCVLIARMCVDVCVCVHARRLVVTDHLKSNKDYEDLVVENARTGLGQDIALYTINCNYPKKKKQKAPPPPVVGAAGQGVVACGDKSVLNVVQEVEGVACGSSAVGLDEMGDVARPCAASGDPPGPSTAAPVVHAELPSPVVATTKGTRAFVACELHLQSLKIETACSLWGQMC